MLTDDFKASLRDSWVSIILGVQAHSLSPERETELARFFLLLGCTAGFAAGAWFV